MNNLIYYSFDDEPVLKFCYNLRDKIIEIQFASYFHLLEKKVFKKSCVLVISKWKDATGKFTSENKMVSLEKRLSIFSLFFEMKIIGDDLHMTVEALNDTYLDLAFISPTIEFRVD